MTTSSWGSFHYGKIGLCVCAHVCMSVCCICVHVLCVCVQCVSACVWYVCCVYVCKCTPEVDVSWLPPITFYHFLNLFIYCNKIFLCSPIWTSLCRPGQPRPNRDLLASASRHVLFNTDPSYLLRQCLTGLELTDSVGLAGQTVPEAQMSLPLQL